MSLLLLDETVWDETPFHISNRFELVVSLSKGVVLVVSF